jgi:outer membrane protein assembly factor BamD
MKHLKKKISSTFMTRFMTGLLTLALIGLSACAKTEQDPFRGYRKYSSAELYQKGGQALAKKHYEQATKYLEAMDALYPFSPNIEQAELDLIYAYYMNGDPASSITAAERFTRLYPRSADIDYAYYMRGVVSFSLGLTWLQKAVGINPGARDLDNLEQANKAFRELVSLYPNSPYAPDARLRIIYIRNLLAQRELSVAEFYYEREAYVAAANRASRIVAHYSGAPVTKDALVLMRDAYRKLGLHELQEKTQHLIQANYP